MKKALTYDDVLLTPQYSDIESRIQVDIQSELDNNILLHLPIISSPMDTVTEDAMALEMFRAGGLGIVHRYNTIREQLDIVDKILQAEKSAHVGAAIGMVGDFKERALALRSGGVAILCVDVAHGYHSLMERCLKTLKDLFGSWVHIIAGSVATVEGFSKLSEWGADSIRVGIGGGSICSTRLVTGHGVPTLQSIIDCAKSSTDTKIIADGGLRTSGDIVKAFAAGADFVMLGSMLAGTREAPGEIFSSDTGKKYKVYRGMASKDAQRKRSKKISTPEGISTTIPYKGNVAAILQDLEGGIRSGFSYSGARNLQEFRAKSVFVKQTSAGQAEGTTHILRRN